MAAQHAAFGGANGSPTYGGGAGGKRRSLVGFAGFGERIFNKARYSIGDPVLHGIKKGATATAVAVSDAMHLPNIGRSITRNHLHPTFEEAVEGDGVFADEKVEDAFCGWNNVVHPTPFHFVKAAGHVWAYRSSVHETEKYYLVVTARSIADHSKLGLYMMDCGTGQWQNYNIKAAPSVRFGHSAVVASNALIVYGGWGRDEVYSDVYFVDLCQAVTRKGRWTEPNFSTRSEPPPRAFHSCVLLDDERMLVFGGSTFDTWKKYSYFDDLWILDLIHFRWEKIVAQGAALAPRAQHTAVTLRRADEQGVDVVVFGGTTVNWLMNDFFYLDTKTFTWTQIHTTECPFERVPSPAKNYKPPNGVHRPAAVFRNSIYVYGGGTKSQGPLQELYCVDLETTPDRQGLFVRWSHLLVKYHPRRFNHMLFCLPDGGLFLVGGSDHTNEGHSDKAKNVYTGVFILDLNMFSVEVDQDAGGVDLDEEEEEDPDTALAQYKFPTAVPQPMGLTTSSASAADARPDSLRQTVTWGAGGAGATGGSGDTLGEESEKGETEAEDEVSESDADSFVTDVAFTMSDPLGGDKRATTSLAASSGKKGGTPRDGKRKSKRDTQSSAGRASGGVGDTFLLSTDVFQSPRNDHVPVHTSKMIGKGTFGKVFQGLHPVTGGYVAVKQLKTTGVPAKEKEKIKVEINLLRGLEHPNVVKYLGSYVKDGKVNIVMEYVSGGSLLDLITQHKTGLPEVVVQKYSRQFITGIRYLHERNLMHRDIKPANILIHATTPVVCKVADFGASKHLRNNTTVFGGTHGGPGTEIQGTPLYMSPEMISGASTNDLRSDVWSIGCTIVEMLDSKRPWHHISHLEAIPLCMYVVSTQEHPIIPPNCSGKANSFLKGCWERDLSKRMTSAGLLAHPWLMDGTAQQPQPPPVEEIADDVVAVTPSPQHRQQPKARDEDAVVARDSQADEAQRFASNQGIVTELAAVREQLATLQVRLGCQSSPLYSSVSPRNPGDSVFSQYEDPEAMLSDVSDEGGDDVDLVMTRLDTPQGGFDSTR